MSNSRSCSSCILISVLAIVACGSPSDDMQAPADADYESSPGAPHHRDAQTSPRDAHGDTDARPDDAAMAIDASDGTIGDGGVLGGGTVSCYSEYAPSATCTLPSHCCFSNYSAEHAGSCDTAACTWGTIDCDGPEDCAIGQRC